MQSVISSIDKIAAVSGEQSEAVAQVTEGITQISGVVQSNSATAEESAAAAGRTFQINDFQFLSLLLQFRSSSHRILV